MSQGGGPSFDLEERLYVGVVQGDVGEYADLLAQIRDVDVRGVKGRTLLHVATRGGKVDWAEALLQKGADPEMRDGDGFTVVEVASQMCSRHPGDGGRESIRRLVRVVHGRDAARTGGPSGVSGASGHGCQNVVKAELNNLKEQIPEALSREVTTLKTSQTQILESLSSSNKEEMASLSTAITSLRAEVVSLRAEVTSQNERQLGVETGMTSTRSEVRNVRETLTSLAEDGRDTREQLKEEMRRLQSDNERLQSSNSKILNCVEEINKRMVQDECISALMAATEILDADEERTAKVRRAYERLYSCSTLTSPLLTFLQRQTGVKVIIDCSSYFIGRMKETVTDLDGVERSGSDFCSFADFKEKKAYVAGGASDEYVSGFLAWALSQLAVSLAFSNGGRPYRVGDEDRGREMRRVVQAAEEEIKKRRLEYYIDRALDKETQSAKEIYLISAVPRIIAAYGPAKGASILSDQVPSLLSFYMDHVLLALSP